MPLPTKPSAAAYRRFERPPKIIPNFLIPNPARLRVPNRSEPKTSAPSFRGPTGSPGARECSRSLSEDRRMSGGTGRSRYRVGRPEHFGSARALRFALRIWLESFQRVMILVVPPRFGVLAGGPRTLVAKHAIAALFLGVIGFGLGKARGQHHTGRENSQQRQHGQNEIKNAHATMVIS